LSYGVGILSCLQSAVYHLRSCRSLDFYRKMAYSKGLGREIKIATIEILKQVQDDELTEKCRL